MLKEFWAAMQCGRHHRRANKFRDRGDLEKAITHFEQALHYAEITRNKGTVAFEMEGAITYQEMEKRTEAMKYAERSLSIYRTLAEGAKDDFFAGAASRVEQLIEKIGA